MTQDEIDNIGEDQVASAIVVRPADGAELGAVAELLAPFVQQRKLLPRTNDELRQLMPTSFTAHDGDRVIGFSSIEIYSRKLAEILCLAVADGYQGRGVGKRLIKACIDLARQRNVLEVMAISSADRFLHDCGFDFTLPDEKKALFYRLRSRHPE